MVVPVSDVDIRRLVDRDAVGLVEPGQGGGAPIPPIARFARPGAGRDDAGPRIDPPDAVIEGVREIEIAGIVEADIEGPVQPRSIGGSPVSGKTRLAGADRRCDQPGLIWHERRPLFHKERS
jgi:hypothetical protein